MEYLALWIKSAHIISVISWMAVLLYLPRLFVYHSAASAGSEQSETFKIMEWRLLKIIGTPAMLLTWIFGIWVAFLFDVWAEYWFMIKFVGVVALSALHMILAKHARSFQNDINEKSEKYFRIINEVPAVIMVFIVILVVVKPF